MNKSPAEHKHAFDNPSDQMLCHGVGREEEQERWGDADEPGLQSLPFHLHHHSRKAAAR